QGAQLAAQHQAIAALVQDLVLDRPDVFIEGDGVVVERAFERSVLDRRLSRLRLFFILIGDLGAGRVRVVLIFLVGRGHVSRRLVFLVVDGGGGLIDSFFVRRFGRLRFLGRRFRGFRLFSRCLCGF